MRETLERVMKAAEAELRAASPGAQRADVQRCFRVNKAKFTSLADISALKSLLNTMPPAVYWLVRQAVISSHPEYTAFANPEYMPADDANCRQFYEAIVEECKNLKDKLSPSSIENLSAHITALKGILTNPDYTQLADYALLLLLKQLLRQTQNQELRLNIILQHACQHTGAPESIVAGLMAILPALGNTGIEPAQLKTIIKTIYTALAEEIYSDFVSTKTATLTGQEKITDKTPQIITDADVLTLTLLPNQPHLQTKTAARVLGQVTQHLYDDMSTRDVDSTGKSTRNRSSSHGSASSEGTGSDTSLIKSGLSEEEQNDAAKENLALMIRLDAVQTRYRAIESKIYTALDAQFAPSASGAKDKITAQQSHWLALAGFPVAMASPYHIHLAKQQVLGHIQQQLNLTLQSHPEKAALIQAFSHRYFQRIAQMHFDAYMQKFSRENAKAIAQCKFNNTSPEDAITAHIEKLGLTQTYIKESLAKKTRAYIADGHGITDAARTAAVDAIRLKLETAYTKALQERRSNPAGMQAFMMKFEHHAATGFADITDTDSKLHAVKQLYEYELLTAEQQQHVKNPLPPAESIIDVALTGEPVALKQPAETPTPDSLDDLIKNAQARNVDFSIFVDTELSATSQDQLQALFTHEKRATDDTTVQRAEQRIRTDYGIDALTLRKIAHTLNDNKTLIYPNQKKNPTASEKASYQLNIDAYFDNLKTYVAHYAAARRLVKQIVYRSQDAKQTDYLREVITIDMADDTLLSKLIKPITESKSKLRTKPGNPDAATVDKKISAAELAIQQAYQEIASQDKLARANGIDATQHHYMDRRAAHRRLRAASTLTSQGGVAALENNVNVPEHLRVNKKVRIKGMMLAKARVYTAAATIQSLTEKYKPTCSAQLEQAIIATFAQKGFYLAATANSLEGCISSIPSEDYQTIDAELKEDVKNYLYAKKQLATKTIAAQIRREDRANKQFLDDYARYRQAELTGAANISSSSFAIATSTKTFIMACLALAAVMGVTATSMAAGVGLILIAAVSPVLWLSVLPRILEDKNWTANEKAAAEFSFTIGVAIVAFALSALFPPFAFMGIAFLAGSAAYAVNYMLQKFGAAQFLIRVFGTQDKDGIISFLNGFNFSNTQRFFLGAFFLGSISLGLSYAGLNAATLISAASLLAATSVAWPLAISLAMAVLIGYIVMTTSAGAWLIDKSTVAKQTLLNQVDFLHERWLEWRTFDIGFKVIYAVKYFGEAVLWLPNQLFVKPSVWLCQRGADFFTYASWAIPKFFVGLIAGAVIAATALFAWLGLISTVTNGANSGIKLLPGATEDVLNKQGETKNELTGQAQTAATITAGVGIATKTPLLLRSMFTSLVNMARSPWQTDKTSMTPVPKSAKAQLYMQLMTNACVQVLIPSFDTETGEANLSSPEEIGQGAGVAAQSLMLNQGPGSDVTRRTHESTHVREQQLARSRVCWEAYKKQTKPEANALTWDAEERRYKWNVPVLMAKTEELTPVASQPNLSS